MNQPAQQQEPPGRTGRMKPRPDHGEESYRGSGRLAGKAAVITRADSGIGRAVAIAVAREGADVLIAYLDEHDDARETARWVEQAGRRAVLVPGDLAGAAHCRLVIDTAVAEFGRVDVLVSNAAQQMTHDKLEDITDEEWDRTLAVNLLADRGIRANSVAPGPVWTPLIPSTMPAEHVKDFGSSASLGRPGQPAEVAPASVMLASDEASYVSGARMAVTGGKPIL
jgi:NAD(P)-dependent dehydrogenase (short-subunit alcohol dehydrogenase family)